MSSAEIIEELLENPVILLQIRFWLLGELLTDTQKLVKLISSMKP